jgi:hypothetical protein
MKRDLAGRIPLLRTSLSSIDLPLIAAVAALPAVALAAHLPSAVLLPALAAFAFAVAALSAALGWLSGTPRPAATVTIWDFAGACVLVGAAAGAFSQSGQVSQLLGLATP